MDPYRALRETRPDLLRAVVEVGLCVTCSRQRQPGETEHDYVQRLGAAAEQRAAEVVCEALGLV